MEEQTFELTEEANSNVVSLYTPNQFSGVTFFGGPFAAGILFYENFKAIGELKKAQLSLFIGFISTVVILGLIFILPEDIIESIPKMVIPIASSLTAKYIAGKYFKHLLEKEEYTKRKFWTAASRSLIGLVPIILFAGALYLYEDAVNSTETPPKNYKVMTFAAGNTIYYDYEVHDSIIDIIGQTMVDAGYFNRLEHNADLIIHKKDSVIAVSFFGEEKYINDTELIEYVKYMGSAINTMIEPRLVIELCVYEDIPVHTFNLTEADTLEPITMDNN